jgi:hypothetical protein
MVAGPRSGLTHIRSPVKGHARRSRQVHTQFRPEIVRGDEVKYVFSGIGQCQKLYLLSQWCIYLTAVVRAECDETISPRPLSEQKLGWRGQI